ncbi:anti-repressor SinI family protein [Cytobacillus firmus]
MTNQLDQEWLQLIAQAQQLGLTIEDIRNFLQSIHKEKNQ